MTSHLDKTTAFRALHAPGSLLVLPNAWDAATARLAEDAGAAAVATTSAGVAWSLGAPDGDHLGRDLAAGLVARVVAAVAVPVTADVEGGYAPDPAGVAQTVRAIAGAGASGINLEDGDGAGLRDTGEQVERIAAAREAATAAGVPLFVNARTDVYLRAVGDPATRLGVTLDRAAAYLAAGADGIFVPGVADPETIAALAAGIDAPLNIMAGPGSPTVPDLAKLGVVRVSVGAAIALSAYAHAARGMREVLTTGTYDSLASDLDYGRMNGLLGKLQE
ncbi:isocitrate lyase/phosphoenolpyruvate mutase family protein [Phytohabitans sp. ZYX-F-186]|uniref:Isocitrate lyase/phosphoenolpyruvate mutase family protein n=1 Tax=Phytohabitans maris TaxID=3071409 RepID=A0ABU0ZPW8_9ACTN|nr:isocitrate lyase/phosphoenolpyruvate mutase family protein [Phytohabitans sp. ZYX-F-186]MDQ7908781.1 isocitrate lyase/phosphoenolpyruvate mutase family protein [Phytohabitans sp. ZYX-F-186]